ncbi:MAG: hypothetical protein PHV30_11000 [Candidatus Margulisbacteria bacterium]|nr:hypothetical protein [Candidatus Margulisiibacteriota bacterium]
MSWSFGEGAITNSNNNNNVIMDHSSAFTEGDKDDLIEILKNTGIKGASDLKAGDISIDGSGVTSCLTFTLDGVQFTVNNDGQITLSKFDESKKFDNDYVTLNGSGGLDATEIGLLKDEMVRINQATEPGKELNLGDTSKMSRLEKAVYLIAQVLNKRFQDILNVVTAMSTGEGWDGLQILADKTANSDLQAQMKLNKEAHDALEYYKDKYKDQDVTVKQSDGVLTVMGTDGSSLGTITLPKDTDFQFDLGVGADGSTTTLANADMKWSNVNDLMESPGTLLTIQTQLQTMKDSLSGIQAAAKAPGDVISKARQDFTRSVAQ